MLGSVDDLDLDEKSADRARFALMQITEAMAPTNVLRRQPGGHQGGGQPPAAARWRRAPATWSPTCATTAACRRRSTPDRSTVGGNLAVSPGAVVYRSEVLELIQYEPTTPTVRERPVMIIPPQVNRFYFLDLAPGRSFIEHAVAQGLQVFTISWRNPTPEQRDWSLDTYVGACLDAAEVACDIAGSDDLNLIGFCAGGITQSLLIGPSRGDRSPARGVEHARRHHHRHRGQELDEHVRQPAQRRVVDRARRAARACSRGRDLARVFAWVRPNDLVWNYWVSNYLTG